MAEVFEVATFYAHFTVIDDEEARIPDITIRVCESLTCNLFKSEQLYSDLVKKHGTKVRILKAPCMGLCDLAPALSIGQQQVGNATVSKVSNIIETKDLKPQIKLVDEKGKVLKSTKGGEARHLLPIDAVLSIPNGTKITAGTVISRIPRETSRSKDITGGLPRVAELFEARKPKDPAIMCEIDGKISFFIIT